MKYSDPELGDIDTDDIEAVNKSIDRANPNYDYIEGLKEIRKTVDPELQSLIDESIEKLKN